MSLFARADNSILARWWWTVDRWLIATVLLLLAVGLLLTFAASTPVAERLGLDSFHFAKRQIAFLAMGLGAMFSVSLLNERAVRRLCILLLPVLMALTVLTLFIGPEIKGATRWIQLGSFTLQPSEFLKPVFIVIAGWMFAEEFKNPDFPGQKIVLGLFALVTLLLVLQPDFGQTILITGVLVGQFILAGLALRWLLAIGGIGLLGGTVAYFTVAHVQRRVDMFFSPETADTYQIDKALSAFRAGGLFGRGPGEGEVKKVLPDAHTDYIFAVAGEEFGTLACIVILAVFAVIVIRGLSHLMEEDDPFVLFATAGLLALFGLQAIVNIGVNLAVLPAKGMTLPFISYGGSSFLALSFSMGMILALTRKREGQKLMRWRRL